MPTQRKIFTVANLGEKFKQAKGLVLSDYSGLNVSQMNELRQLVLQAGGEFEVVKNTLLNLAAKNAKVTIAPEALQMPTAALWLYENQIKPLKAFFQFVDQNLSPKPKFGLVEGMAITVERLKELASLPTKKELQAKLTATLKSPLFGLNQVLNWNQQKLVFVLKSIKGGEKNGKR